MSKVLPNQVLAHQTPADAWQYVKMLISSYGDKVIAEDRKITTEIENLHLTILKPLDGWPVRGSGWESMGALDEYAEQLLSGENPSGFEYTYGERLVDYPDFQSDEGNGWHQIEMIINRLKKDATTRRAIAITNVPAWDLCSREIPCLQLLDFLIRGGKLNMTAVFRSWDVLRAAPCNLYGLAKLQKHVAEGAGVPMGSMTIFAVSAHIYMD